MNIRNLLFIIMIVCAAPVVCAPSIRLAKKEQVCIKKLVKLLKENTSVQQRKIIKDAISLIKNSVVVGLQKARIGRNFADYQIEMDNLVGKQVGEQLKQLMDKFTLEPEQVINWKAIDRILIKALDIFFPKKGMFTTVEKRIEALEKRIDSFKSAKTITREHIRAGRKLVIICSFILKCM